MANFLLFGLFSYNFKILKLLYPVCNVRYNCPNNGKSNHFVDYNSKNKLVKMIEVLSCIYYFPKDCDVCIGELEKECLLDKRVVVVRFVFVVLEIIQLLRKCFVDSICPACNCSVDDS